MKIQLRIVLLTLLAAIVLSCNKKPIDHPEYIGGWLGDPSISEYLTISSDGAGYYYYHDAESVDYKGKVHIDKSHLNISLSKFCIIEPPTQIDTTNFYGQLVTWEMHLQGPAGEDMRLHKK